MKPKKVAVLLVLAALCVVTNYAMITFYNIKFMDMIVFVGGFCFGPFIGALMGMTSWTVYGTFNPMGFSLPIWLAVMASEAVYGVVGGLLGKVFIDSKLDLSKNATVSAHIFFGMLGVLLTFAYDIVTNAVFGYFQYQSIIVGVIVGFIPFGLVHVVSNAAFFGLGCVPAIRAIQIVVGRQGHGDV